MVMIRWIMIASVAAIMIAMATCLPGCGNVYLSGDALTCTEVSATDAFNAAQRAQPDPNIPNWMKGYLDENFKQWRSYVRSAKRDMTWGPTLPEERGLPVVPPK